MSALVDRVKHGETVLIVDRGRPVARLESVVGEASGDPEGRIARLERGGVVKRARMPLPKDVLARKPPRARRGARISQALIEERRDGR